MHQCSLSCPTLIAVLERPLISAIYPLPANGVSFRDLAPHRPAMVTSVVNDAPARRPVVPFPLEPCSLHTLADVVCDWTAAISDSRLIESPCAVCAQLVSAQTLVDIDIVSTHFQRLYSRAAIVCPNLFRSADPSTCMLCAAV